MSLLPEAYAQLEPFVGQWALPTTAQRTMARSTSTAEERQAFYDAMSPLAASVIEGLDAKPLAALSDVETRLLDMALAYAHVALAVEIQGREEAWHRQWRDRMVVTRSPADLPA